MAQSSLPSTPLFNHLVLDKILDRLDFSDIKNRLVCSFWNEISKPYIIKSAEAYLEGNALEQLLNSCTEKTLLSESNSEMRITHFENYIIKINSLLSIHDGLGNMWSTIHLNIKILTIHITTLYARKELKTLLLHMLPVLTKLKIVVMKYWGMMNQELIEVPEYCINNIQANENLTFFQLSYLGSISLYGYDEGECEEFVFPLEWTSFFTRFPGLKHFSLIGLNSLDISRMICALEMIQSSETERDIALNSLEILDENIFPEAPTDEHLSGLAKLEYNLEHIHLELSPVISTHIFNSLIEKQASSLKELRLRRYPHPYLSPPITLNIELHLLTFLEISDSLTPSLAFLPHMPCLQTLHIILRDYSHLQCCEMLQNTPNPNRLVHTGVKCVYIEPPVVSEECIQKLAICFPNLETLRIRVNDAMFHEICTQAQANQPWKNLRSLYITSWDGLTDEGITGISQQVLKFWGGYSSFEARKHRVKPYIGNILGLQTLTIEMWSDYDNYISDWSLLYGIIDLENLAELTLIRTDISANALKSLPVPSKRVVY